MLDGGFFMSDFFIKLDNIAVKGKSEGVEIYTILSPESSVEDRNKHNKMFENYQKQQWNQAIAKCIELKGAFNGELDYYYDMMIKRIKMYDKDESFPVDWDGIYIATTK